MVRFQHLIKSHPGSLILLLTVAAVVFSSPWMYQKYRLYRGKAALKERNAAEALGWLQSAVDFNPKSAEAQFLLARAYRREGRMDLVHTHLQKSWELGTPRDKIEREEWLALAQSGQMSIAGPRLKSLLLEPGEDGPEICEAYVNGYLRNFEFHLASVIIDTWEAQYPEDSQPHYCRGRMWESLMQSKNAAACYRKGLALDPERMDLQLGLARSLSQLREYDDAEAAFLKCLSADPDNEEALSGVAWCAVKQGRLADAKARFQSLLERNPENISARYGLAQIDLSEDRPEQAADRLSELVAETPHHLDARFAYASALADLGRQEEAEEHFRKVQEEREFEQRLQLLTERLMENPKDDQTRYEIGRGYVDRNRAKEGLPWLLSVLEINKHHKETHALLADYYQKQGSPELAEKHRREAR